MGFGDGHAMDDASTRVGSDLRGHFERIRGNNRRTLFIARHTNVFERLRMFFGPGWPYLHFRESGGAGLSRVRLVRCVFFTHNSPSIVGRPPGTFTAGSAELAAP